MIIGLQHPITIEVQATITVKPASVDVVPEPVEPAPDPVDPPADPDPVDPDPADPDPIPDPVEPVDPANVIPITDSVSLEYIGGFRLSNDTVGVSRPAYSAGVISATDDGLWIAGHLHHRAIGKYQIPALTPTYDMASMPVATNLSPFVKIDPEPWEESARVTGIYEKGGRVFATVQHYYDANNSNLNDLAIINSDGSQDGYFSLDGGAMAAGWMNKTPPEYVDRIGPYYMGSSSQLAINSRLSHGPSLYGWDGEVTTTPIMVFPFSNPMGSMGTEPAPVNDMWNELAYVGAAFIHNGKYIAVGQIAGLRSGIDYKIRGSNGYITVEPDDTYSYFWVFDMEDILNASEVHAPRPESYGVLAVPFFVHGASFHDGYLYLCDKDGGGPGSPYEHQPVVYKYRVI